MRFFREPLQSGVVVNCVMIVKTPARLAYLLLLLLLVSCRHDYTSDSLDLGFYQWNFWIDEQAAGVTDPAPHAPTCGWEEMERGVGKLVRVPAVVGDHFPEGAEGPAWYHVRYTLPELWEGSDITIHFEGVNGDLELYLNGELAASHPSADSAFSLDLTGKIFYFRDNHMCIRVHGQDPSATGITGQVRLNSDYLSNPEETPAG